MSEDNDYVSIIDDIEFGAFPECIPKELDPFFEPESYG